MNTETTKKAKRPLLKHRTCKDWMQRINRIENNRLKVKIICIVWWDYLADLDIDECMEELGKVVKGNNDLKEPTSDEVRMELIRLGYSLFMAERRSYNPSHATQFAED